PPVVDGGQPPGKRGCADDRVRCGAKCVDINHDTSNCGCCGTDNPKCRCSANQDCCNGFCIDINTRSNCGACGAPCRFGEDCCYNPGIPGPIAWPWECVAVNTTSKCGDCQHSRACDPGQDCCYDAPSMRWECVQLGTDSDCTRCGEDCFASGK